MKFRLTYLAAAIIACASCSNGKPPESVAQTFLTLMQQRQYAQAKKLATGASSNMLEALASSPQNIFPIKENDTYKISSFNTRNDSCIVRIQITGKAYPMKLLLLKQSGSWKVAYDIETLFRMSEQ